jgi:putative ABC transport system ATP-binding protein
MSSHDVPPCAAEPSWPAPAPDADLGPGAPEPVVRLDDVVKEYPSTPPVRAVDGISFSIAAGELLSIVGPSGSGKSTLLHVIGTLDRPTSGTLHIAGHDVSGLSDRQLSALRAHSIGFVFQQFFLLSGYSALDNVADGLLYTGRPLRERHARAHDALERVGLASRVGHLATELSGGERQRVAIARALVGSPAIVLADEPTGNLDSRSSGAIIELLHELNDEGTTIVVITHDHDIAERLPRIVAIRDGRIERDERRDLVPT